MQPRFIHLRLHTEYSLSDGLVRIKPLIKRIAALKMPAVSVTDQGNLFALVKFYKAALGAGIKPIAGADIWLANEADIAAPFRLTLLARNAIGYGSLTELISRSFVEGQHQGMPMVRGEWLAQHNQGLIVLSGGREGQIGQWLLTGRDKEAGQVLHHYLALFPDCFYLELQRTGRPQEEAYIDAAVELACRCDTPVVASNDVRFLKSSEFEAHEARVCIHQGRVLEDPRRPKPYSDQQYLRSSEEMLELFADIPSALENTVEIAKRCNLELTLGKPVLPDFPVPEGMTPEQFFDQQARQGLAERFIRYPPKGPVEPYWERLDTELSVILQMGFPGYFLIVADFIQWAKAEGIPVGPGRGSGAGSLVAYALKITDLDPLEFDLLFERFLNPERVSMPDFDIDFCMERRDEVIDYVARKYGRERVSQIITYGSMAAKAVVRDVGRVLGHPYGFVDRLAKLIPFELGITLKKALKDNEDLRKQYEDDEDVHILIDLAMQLEGLSRNVSKHAGGVVIAPSRLVDFVPLYCEAGGANLVTQFDKDDVEAVGLVKFDFLGLRTLTIIAWAVQTINRGRTKAGEPLLDITQIPRDDPASYALLKRHATTAVFQLESRGMKDLIRRLQPDCFEDIIALVALFRPGPLQSGMVDDFIARKHGKAKVDYPHPSLEGILKPTYGVIVYQEQVMQIAQVLAGYTLGGADLLRRAMGKKKAEEMAQQRDIFVTGSTGLGIQETTASYIFDLMERFAEYGFNKTLSPDTKIRTIAGNKNIEDCRAGDVVFSMNADGSVAQSHAVALHDHGKVPLWLVEFDDGIREKCTLDHKWLTEYGQLPLWKILQMGIQVRGNSATETRYFDTTVSHLHEHDSFRTQCRQRTGDVLWSDYSYTEENNRTFPVMFGLSDATLRNSAANVQRLATYRTNAAKIFGICQANGVTSRYSATTRCQTKKMARRKSRKVRYDSSQSSCFAQIFKNGKLSGTLFSQQGLCSQCSPDQLAIDSVINGVLQRQYGRTHFSQPSYTIQQNRRHQLARHLVFRKPIRATFLGWHQGYDLEIDHPEHNFLLASGLCCSNSHSAAYALVAYQTAWLKAHYPAEFMAAVMSADMDNTDKVVVLIEECRDMALKVLPPDINRSEFQFTVQEPPRPVGEGWGEGSRQILYGLGAVKGVGESAINDILAERKTGGAFQNLTDLCCRVDNRKANRRVLEALVKSGTFDSLDPDRARHIAELPLALKVAEQQGRMDRCGQEDLFGLESVSVAAEAPAGAAVEPWPEEQRLAEEKATLGLYLTGHPIARYEQELSNIVTASLGKIAELAESRSGGSGYGRNRANEQPAIIAGLVVDLRSRQNKQGKRMAFATLDDRTGRLEVAVFAEVYDKYRDFLSRDSLVVAEGVLGMDDFTNQPRLSAERVYSIDEARERHAKQLLIRWPEGLDGEGPGLVRELQALLAPFQGGRCPLWVEYQAAGAKTMLRLGEAWRVRPGDELLGRLEKRFGAERVSVNYPALKGGSCKNQGP